MRWILFAQIQVMDRLKIAWWFIDFDYILCLENSFFTGIITVFKMLKEFLNDIMTSFNTNFEQYWNQLYGTEEITGLWDLVHKINWANLS